MNYHLDGFRTEINLSTSPCPRVTGLVSLIYILVVLLFLAHQLNLVFAGSPELERNYWLSEYSMPLTQAKVNLTQDYIFGPEDIHVSVVKS
jgi:hypothetical protein